VHFDLIFSVVANSRVIQTARYGHLTILTVLFVVSWNRDRPQLWR